MPPSFSDPQPAPSNYKKSFDAVGFSTERYTSFEVLLLQSLSATQRQQIDAVYKKLGAEKLQLAQELVDLFKAEASDYPDLVLLPMNDDNPHYKALAKEQYPQFQTPRENVYAEVEQDWKKSKKTVDSRKTPSCSIDEYRQKESALAAKLETCLNANWLQVKPILTQSQLAELAKVRRTWNDSVKSFAQTQAKPPKTK